MGLFICDECGSVENTALGQWWGRKVIGAGWALCSACSTGEWHGRFERVPWDGKRTVLNPPQPDEDVRP